MDDPRRRIPRTDALLALPGMAASQLSSPQIRAIIRQVQQQARDGEISPEEVADRVLTQALANPCGMSTVINATGVVVHTNLGRAPLSAAALAAVKQAGGYADVEFDLATGKRSSRRGHSARQALLAACPEAEAALVVNNGAAALLLATAVVESVAISRGELIEIGAGFRLPELISSAGTTLVEVGSTNRTHPYDYHAALSEGVAAIVKVYPSNYRVVGFSSSVTVTQLRSICDEYGAFLIVDIGSGLLQPDPALPEEPDAYSVLRAGADAVICSGDKLLGGPQAGVVLGKSELVAAMGRHPLARAVRADKLSLAALEATVRQAETPVYRYLHQDAAQLRHRLEKIQEHVGYGEIVNHDGCVGGGGAPGIALHGFALSLPARLAPCLRAWTPPIIGRVHGGQLLIDVRCVEPHHDKEIVAALVGQE